MSLFSDDRFADLRDLFFDSAQELLQSLNEQGLELEKRPGDIELIRGVRRSVHTLKGDSAACGFKELSDLAHELEDVLTPELAANPNGSVADVVLSAADTFHEMLAAYRTQQPPPQASALRQMIQRLTSAPLQARPEQVVEVSFRWSQSEQAVLKEAAAEAPVLQLALLIDQASPVRSAAVQLARKVLKECGRLLAIHPEQDSRDVTIIHAAVSTTRDEQWLTRKCKIPAVVTQVVVFPYVPEMFADCHPDPELVEGEGPLSSSEISNECHAERRASAPSRSTSVRQDAATQAPPDLLRIDAQKIDEVMNLVGELVVGKSMLHQAFSDFSRRFGKDPLSTRLADALAFQARVLGELQKSVMKVRMVPVEHLFRRFPRLVRDVARISGKEVELVMTGETTELDKTILDTLAEPLTHLLRNAVDHGIEPPQERLAAGKPAAGCIWLKAYHQGSQIVIEVSDDGRGLDRQRLAAKALERGILTRSEVERMNEAECLNLVFHPGFSTAEQVTELSGRGVGMDVVKTVLDGLKGTVQIDSVPGQGATFRLKVPLTMAIIKALLFRLGERLYALPLNSVLEIVRASEEQVHRVEDHEVIQLRNEVITLVRLDRWMGAAAKGSGKLFMIIVGIADRKFGLIVDKLAGEEELVIKALDDHLVSTDLVSGASILGDGNVVLILNTPVVVSRFARTADPSLQDCHPERSEGPLSPSEISHPCHAEGGASAPSRSISVRADAAPKEFLQ